MRSIVVVDEYANSHDLTTLDAAKRELGVTGTENDVQILDQICKASSTISAYCNRVFGMETLTETFIDATFRGPIPLRRRPVQLINWVQWNSGVVSQSDYLLERESGLLHRVGYSSMFYSWNGTIAVNYDSGYLLMDDLPHAIERACLLLVKQYHFAMERDPLLRSEEIPGVATYAYGLGTLSGSSNELPPEVQILLSPFRELAYA